MKTPLQGKLDLKIMKAYEREIMKRLNLRNEAMDLDSPEDDPPRLSLSEDEEEIQTEPHAKIKDTLVPNPPSPSASLPTELKELPFKVNE
ncbi:hypothetical protein Tco_1449563 [Tanacetum coccineum]